MATVENRLPPPPRRGHRSSPLRPNSESRCFVAASIHTDAEGAAVLSPLITEQRYALHSPAVTPLGKRNHRGILYRELISRRTIVF
jgi:hypothetical protein